MYSSHIFKEDPSRAAALNAMQNSVDWLRKYRNNNPQDIPFSKACADVKLNIRTANDIIARGRPCSLSTFYRLLKVHNMQLAIEDGDGELILLNDPVGIPRQVKEEIRWRIAVKNKVSDFRLLTWKELYEQLNLDRLTTQKIFYMEYECPRGNRNVTTMSLFSVLHHLDTPLWIVRDDKSKERMLRLL